MGLFDSDSEIHFSECRKKTFSFGALAILIFMTYANTFHASWHFDDKPNILDATQLHPASLTWSELKKSFYHEQSGQKRIYRPVARLSLALNYYFGKRNVFGYHVTNLLIHFVSAFVLFLFVYHLLRSPALKEKYGPHAYFMALLASVLWAINPIQTQAVTYVVQRMASMAGMFYILAVYFYLMGRTADNRRLRSLYLVFCLLSTLLAFGSKENAFVLPIVLLFMETTLIRSGIPKNGKRRLFLVAAVLSAVLFLSVLYYLSAHGNPMDFLDKYQKRVFTFQERLLTQPRVILFYISLIFYPMPTRLSLVHDVQASTSLFDPPGTLLSIGVILFLALAALRFMKKWPLLSFCVIFFLLNHLIESSIFALELIFEHRNYIPSMLMFVPVAALVVRGLDYYTRKKPMQIVISVFITLIIIGFGHSTFMRNFVWTHNESLWLDALDKAPGVWRPYHGLGKYYSDRNQKEKALEMYNQGLTKRSIANKHDKAITYYNLGLEYFRRRDQEKSLEYYLKAVKLWPGFADAHHNIGIVLASRNEYGRAIRAFRNTLTLDKNYHFAHSNIGFVFIKQGRYEAAIKELQMALKQTPHNIPTQQRLGVAYMGLEKYHEALKYFRGVLRQNPRDVTTLLFSAQTYHLLGRNDAAQRILDKAVPLLSDERLKGLAEKAPSFGEITPDGDILFPLLAEAYARRADLYSEKRAFCTEHSEVGREEGRP